MKICFNGDVAGLRDGIDLLAPELGISVAEGGYTFTAKQVSEPTLRVSFNKNEGEIVYAEPCQFFRALGLAVEALRAGKDCFSISEKPQFKTIGSMFDIAQGNAAFNLKSAKEVLRLLALMGHNMMMLYCEDCVQVQNYPYFGYMRPS